MSKTAGVTSAVLMMVSLAGCTGGGTDFEARFTDACTTSSNLPDEHCTCMAERAQDELSEDARVFLLASLEGDDAAIEEARARLGITEAMQAGMFMTSVGECAG